MNMSVIHFVTTLQNSLHSYSSPSSPSADSLISTTSTHHSSGRNLPLLDDSMSRPPNSRLICPPFYTRIHPHLHTANLPTLCPRQALILRRRRLVLLDKQPLLLLDHPLHDIIDILSQYIQRFRIDICIRDKRSEVDYTSAHHMLDNARGGADRRDARGVLHRISPTWVFLHWLASVRHIGLFRIGTKGCFRVLCRNRG